MHGERSIRDDSALLARWAREGNEDAFTELVQQYHRLVLGAALRRTGDAELARDVAQQVFTTLAAKARTLLGRTNVAGWLYQAASHIGARAAQAEMRRRGAHERSAKEPTNNSSVDAQWPLVEDAMARLGESERESLVLHYFQDLSYPEMARALSIEESAARKRVSRALQSLETQLRRRGIGGSATALLTAAAAQQVAVPAQAGLAAAVLSSIPAAAPLSITIAMLMSQTTIKIACAAALIATPLALEWKDNAKLRTEIASIRSARTPLAAVPAAVDPVANANASLTATRTARIAAENRVSELLDLKNKVETEVIVSLGSVDVMAKKIAKTVRLFKTLEKLKESKPAPGTVEHRKGVAMAEEAAEGMTDLFSLLREIPRLERSPEKAARFYATLYGEAGELGEAERTLFEEQTRDWLRGLQNEGLALPQRPKGKADEWDQRRFAATKKLFATLSRQLPPPKPDAPNLEELFEFGGAKDGSPFSYEMITGDEKP